MPEWLKFVIDLFLHLDKHLTTALEVLGPWTYVLLVVIIFLETGLVVTPFLPGDSLIFAAGTFAALGQMNVALLFLLLASAAILGDTVNYWIGHRLGLRLFQTQNRWLKKVLKEEHLIRTQEFYDKYGGFAVVLGRFVPIVRTFVPFVAGIGAMNYSRFIYYNVVGALAWVGLFLFLGYFFGNIPIIKANFHYAVIGIILVSVLPMVWEYWKHRRQQPRASATD
ncbi:MAG: DedA family protein [Chloroflexi bacterium]|nr:DedA family protein [Chloroflexota bacterium]